MYKCIMIIVVFLVARWIPQLAVWSLNRKGIKNTQYQINTFFLQVLAVILAVVVCFQKIAIQEIILGVCFTLLLILVSLTDVCGYLIPNIFTYSAVCFFFLFRLVYHDKLLTNYLLASIISYSVLFLIGWLTKGMGGGDAKLLGLCGLVLGWPNIFLAFWIATVSALVFWFLFSEKREKMAQFGPHIALGSYLVYIWGDLLIKWYFSVLEILYRL